MSTSRKQFFTVPELFIQLGPDRFHPTMIGPLTVREALAFLRHATPENAYRAAYPAGKTPSREIDLLGAAVYDWNSAFASDGNEERAELSEFVWLGFAVKATCDELDVWISTMHGEKGSCTVAINQDALEGQARTCALAALAALAPVAKPGGNR